MSTFEEFLKDYEEKEKREEEEKFMKKLAEGKLSSNDMYPPPEHFVRLKEPIAHYDATIGSIWGVVPFYGSTIIGLEATKNKKIFDKYYSEWFGFTSNNINEIIDFVKETGKIQFILMDNPTRYNNLEFLRPLFEELKPPHGFNLTADLIIGEKNFRKCVTEFFTLSEFGFLRYIERIAQSHLNINIPPSEIYFPYIEIYSLIRTLLDEKIGDELETLMILDYPQAHTIFNAFDWLIVSDLCSTLKGIKTFNSEKLIAIHEFEKKINKKIPIPEPIIPCDIGRFILNKIVLYPETFDGCKEVVYHYEENDLYKTLEALYGGVKKRETEIVSNQVNELSTILNNIWEDVNKLKFKSEGVNVGISTSIGLIGELATALPGTGILSMLGFQVLDKIVGLKSDSISEKIAKFISPNYLVTMYDFKKRHNIQK